MYCPNILQKRCYFKVSNTIQASNKLIIYLSELFEPKFNHLDRLCKSITAGLYHKVKECTHSYCSTFCTSNPDTVSKNNLLFIRGLQDVHQYYNI